MDIAKYKKIFLEESREHLKGLGDGFVLLEKNPHDQGSIDELFRHAHSLKGMSSSMGYEEIAFLSHAMEDILGLLRKREIKVNPELIDLFLLSLDRMEKMIGEVNVQDKITTRSEDVVARLRGLVKREREEVVEAVEEDLEEIVPLGVSTSEAPPSLPSGKPPESSGVVRSMLGRLDGKRKKMLREYSRSNLHPYHLEVMLDAESPALAARDFIILSKLSKTGVVVASVPDMEEVRKGAAAERLQVCLLYGAGASDLSRLVKSIPEVREVSVAAVPDSLWEEGLGASPPAAGPPPTKLILPEVARKIQTVRVDTGVLDDLINMVGELLIRHERLMAMAAGAGEELIDEIVLLGGIIRRFQETIMDVRMMPLDLVAGRFPRMVRDLARRVGKEVLFEVDGLQIKLDRAILEDVGEVLVHLLRNAVDHGLESPADRERLGKKREGRIRFRASREKDWVLISVSDDGRGIDLDAVRAKVLETGLATQASLAGMDREEIMMLTTLPGFSTAREVTDVSGRGVGLDAVRSMVESLGGSLSLHSLPGEETTATVRIPLSLAVIQILVVRIDGQYYGFPVSRVHHTAEVEADMVREAGSQQYFREGRSLIRLVGLADILGMRGRVEERRSGPAVIVKKGRRKVGLLVDELLGSKDAVIKPLGQPLMRIPALAGATILGDGRPMIILDLHRLI